MALVEPYDPCPCGSGEKYKWCCQKTEAFSERAERLMKGGQLDGAVEALDEGLRKNPGNPWLSLRKAVILLRQDKLDVARDTLERLLAKHPSNLNGHSFLIQAYLRNEDAPNAIAQLQKALDVCPDEHLASLATLIRVLGMYLVESAHIVPALKHFELAVDLAAGDPQVVRELATSLHQVRNDPQLPTIARNPFSLLGAPANLSAPNRERFEKALSAAQRGRWAFAAPEFEKLAKSGIVEAEYNLGFCRLWLGHELEGVGSLRNYIAKTGETVENVDLEALCQLPIEIDEDSLVDQVRLSWPVRNRSRLLELLNASREFESHGRMHLVEDDEESPFVDVFTMLDRPRPEGNALPSRSAELPLILAAVRVGDDVVLLDAYDDGTLDALSSRFTDFAVPTIPPAHPKSKVLGRTTREVIALRVNPWLPDDVDPKVAARIEGELRASRIQAAWPDIPSPFLRGRTPRQAAKAGDAKVALRAMILRLESDFEASEVDINGSAIRASLGLAEEPAIDPETVVIEKVSLLRLARVPVTRLDDTRLTALYRRARSFGQIGTLARAAQALVERPAILDRPDVGRVMPFIDLSNIAVARGKPAEALSWLERGQGEDPQGRGSNAIHWDLALLTVRTASEPPESWVPHLAVLLDRYSKNGEQNAALLSKLVSMNLVRVVKDPQSAEGYYLDPRPLQAVLAEYGPKITTASGELGVSATQGGIWTPGSSAGGGTTPGGLWTPGASTTAAGGPEKPKLIIPGR